MRRITVIIVATMLFAACGGASRSGHSKPATRVAPRHYTYEVVAEYPHSERSYTQGLQWVDGQMWEGTGHCGASVLQRIDLATGDVDIVARLARNEFGEGITLLGERIYQLTWQNGVMHIYDRRSLREIATHRYRGEGWGLTSDGQMLYMSDGTPDIRVIDPQTLASVRTIAVTLEGESLPYLNELEWIDGRIWANVYTYDKIVIIDPSSGVVEGVVDLEGLLPESDRGPATDVLNGIAWDSEARRLFVTGKNWPKLFELRIVEN
ncbi:MAG: glutaminyl-peptide cyclotransferase [Alistipes sp.]|nr:glutaminyl-peptide cyclotransferase [Alistipes sp.]